MVYRGMDNTKWRYEVLLPILQKMIFEPSYERVVLSPGWSGLIVRQSELFHLCGYVRVPHKSPLVGMDYSKIDLKIEVHGGLTFSGRPWDEKGKEQLDGWWFGFDCAHAGDITFPTLTPELSVREQYRDIDYVRNEVRRLHQQLKKLDKDMRASTPSSHPSEASD